jgi:hypothetical protein
MYAPTVVEYFWVLDLNILDYKLTPLMVMEEVVAPTLEIMIGGFRFCLPSNWNILVVDEDSMVLDVIELSEVAGREFRALVYGPNMPTATSEIITVTDFHPSFTNVGPALNKHQMLCHPIRPGAWINVSPSDTYNKYLKDKVVGDII